MSLVRLLTTGKSLVGMQDNLSRYRLTKQRLLPKFNSKKNPFAPPIKAEPAKPAPAVAEAVLPAAARSEAAAFFENKAGEPAAVKVRSIERGTLSYPGTVERGPAGASPCHNTSVESISVPPAKTGTKADGATAVVPPREPVLANRNGQRDLAPPLAARSRKSALAGNWLKVAGLLSGFLERKQKAAGLKPARTPVQCELSLEKVKVVRNDLSDADLEFRTARRPVPPPAASPFSPPALDPARHEPTAWGRLTSRFFKAGQTQNH
jgi:hypothetical protein